jgi:hypothetical protein
VYDSATQIACASISPSVRWWVYVRNDQIWGMREAPLGFFSVEVLLVNIGYGVKPKGLECAYESSTDTVTVTFTQHNQVYKFTGLSMDTLSTISYTRTPTVSDAGRLGEGAGGNCGLITLGNGTVIYV